MKSETRVGTQDKRKGGIHESKKAGWRQAGLER
jgi:hypothetical protein